MEEYRKASSKSAVLTSKYLIEKLEIEPVFKATRIQRQAGETDSYERVNPEKKHKFNVSNVF